MWWRWAIWVMRASLPSGPPRLSLPTPPASTCPLDGHSHEQYERTLPNREGKDVVLAQTGTGLTAIGQVILDPVTGEIQAELVAGYAGRDPEMEEEIAAVQAQYEEQLSQVVGSTDVALVTTDPATGEYWVRSRETNLGDFCADAYRAVMGADIAFVNGGGIRAELAPGGGHLWGHPGPAPLWQRPVPGGGHRTADPGRLGDGGTEVSPDQRRFPPGVRPDLYH